VPLILERNGPGPVAGPPPYPGLTPGSLALFREGGALRAIGSGGFPDTLQLESERPPPAGFPPTLIPPYPLATGYVVRQTATGWSDEEHERNPAQDPLGEYKAYDTVYQPDPTSAVLIDPTGTQGWAVGGNIDNSASGALDTADASRYPAEASCPGSPPPRSERRRPGHLRDHGGARCLAPCAACANARIGPDV
jgi:hypothetical protein